MAIKQGNRQIQRHKFSLLQRLTGELLEIPLLEMDARIEQEQEVNPYLEQNLELIEEPQIFETTEQEGRRNHKGEFLDYWFQDDGDHIYRVSNRDENTEKEFNRSFSASLTEDLLQQLRLSNISPTEYSIGELIIGNIDERGYLQRSLTAMADDYFFEYGKDIPKEKFDKMLTLVRSFEPAGIGAFDLKDCLMLQIERMKPDNPDIELAKLVIRKHWNAFFRKQYDLVIKRLGIDFKTFDRVFKIIKSLNPQPGYGDESAVDNSYILPDFIVWYANNEVKFRLNKQYRRNLVVSSEGKRMLEEEEKKENKNEETIRFLKNKIDSAALFIKAFEKREDTLNMVMKTIIDLQYDYFVAGDRSKLKPLKYEDIKKITGLSESSISRMVTNKHARTHFGTFRLKEFFSNTLLDASGEQVSSTAVRSCLVDVLSTEDPNNPLTDEQLAKMLSEKGFPISRRTVAKYRDKLGIDIASKRKQKR